MKEKEDREKNDKLLRRRQIEYENQYHLDQMRNSRNRDGDSGYHLDIGVRSEYERRKREEKNKKEMMDTLDKQIQIKE